MRRQTLLLALVLAAGPARAAGWRQALRELVAGPQAVEPQAAAAPLAAAAAQGAAAPQAVAALPQLSAAAAAAAAPAAAPAASVAAAFDGPPPTYTDNRSVDFYEELTGLDLKAGLRRGDLYVDVGAGRGYAIGALRPTGARLIAVQGHRSYHAAGVENVYAILPDDRSVLREHAGRAKRVTDVFGAGSYGRDTLEALLYEAALLGPGGQMAAIMRPRRLGGEGALARVEEFFASKLGQLAQTRLVAYPVPVSPSRRARRDPIMSLRVSVSGPSRGMPLDEALGEARRFVGEPAVKEVLFRGDDGRTVMRAIEYQK